jgi:putative DNA primase/helicase
MIGTDRWRVESLNGDGEVTIAAGDETSFHWEPNIVSMNSIQPRPVEWLWKHRIPNGKLVSLSGNPGLGKTLVLMDIAARVTTGADWPDGCPGTAPGGVVICSAEDDPHDTLRPRLDAARADVARINLVQSVVQMDAKKKRSERLIDLQRDLSAIGTALDATADCRLFIMDPINAYLGKTDSHKNAEVRSILGPVAEMCHRKRVAFIYLGHLNKSTNGPAMYRTAGSLAFVAAARVAYIVAEDKQDANVRLFLPVKNNLAPNIGGLSFTIATENDQPRIEWNHTAITTTADEALSHDAKQSKGNLERDKEWLSAQLAKGPRYSDELFEEAKASGISRNRLYKAKDAAGASARKNGFGDQAKWEWFLL